MTSGAMWGRNQSNSTPLANPLPLVRRKPLSKTFQPLTEAQVEAATPSDKRFKLFDGGGLYLLVTSNGGKWWRFKYRFEGREKLLSLGMYPVVTLSNARQLREDARQLLDTGRDPSAVRKEETAKQRALESTTEGLPSVKLAMGGGIEIWKGRAVIRLNGEEAQFVSDMLNKLR